MRIRQLTWPLRGLARLGGPVHAGAQGAAAVSPEWIRTQFRRTDDGAGGLLQTLRRRVKFWMRCRLRSRALALGATAFRNRALQALAEQRPELALRPLRSYLRRGLPASRRAECLRAHFEWVAAHLPRAAIDRLYADEFVALLAPGRSPVEGLGLSLSIAGAQGREGELALHLEWHGQRAMSIAFSVLDAACVLDAAEAPLPPGPRIVIGSLQGARGADEALRALSAAAQRLRPSALLVIAAQAVTQAWTLQPPLGVAAASHAYAGYASRSRSVALDYDAAWRDAGAGRAGRHYWALPARPLLRPDAEVESRRRAQHRRRNALREQLFDAVRDGAAGLAAAPYRPRALRPAA